MPLPSTREDLKNFCLRKLGAPVIQINVSQEQLEDRIDEVLEYFQQYHFDGVEQIYLKHKITASHMKFSNPNAAGAFALNDAIVGNTSGAKASVYDMDADTFGLRFITALDSPAAFIPGEQVYNTRTLNVANIATTPNSIVIGDLDNRWIPCDASIISVLKILPLTSSPLNMFDVRYQFALNNMPNLLGMDIISYKMYNQHLALLQEMFYGEKYIRHNKKQDRITIDFDWQRDVLPDQYIIVECWKSLDPENYTKVYGDYWVREYATAVIKKQWATNMSKFEQIELPGGVKLNATKLYDDAVNEIKVLDERLHKEFQDPIDFMVG